MAHKHGVYDGDMRFKIDPVTRKIANKSGKNTLMLGDHNSERFSFEIPRTVDGHSMEQCTVEVHYTNTDAQTGQESKDVYTVKDLQLAPDDANVVICSWLLTKTATMYAGPLVFSLHFKCLNGAEIDYQWSTEDNTDFTIRANTYNTEGVAAENTDALAQWKVDIAGVVEEGKQDIVDQGEAVKASIPADYTALSATADDNRRNKAPAIVPTAQGETIAVADASDCYLQGLRIFGKSTQDGIPTPDAPVEIVSVGPNIGVSLHRTNIAYFADVDGATESGVTWSCKDGVFTASGTSTAISATGKIAVCNITGMVGTFFISGSTENVGVFVAAERNGAMAWYSERSFTLDGTETSAVVYCQIASGVTVSNEKVYPMLNRGNNPAEWEKGGPVQAMFLAPAAGLSGIPVTSGGNYTDANGQQWICDEIDLARGVYVQRIQTITFDGTEEWYINNADNTPSNINRYFIADVLPKALSGGPVFGLLCNVANWAGEIASDSFSEEGCIQGYGFTAYPGWIGLAMNKTSCPDVASFKAKLTALAAAGTPVKVYVANRVAPTETALTDAEIAAFKALHSNYPNTTVFNDAGAYMEMAYVADTKTYIDNKLLELMQS